MTRRSDRLLGIIVTVLVTSAITTIVVAWTMAVEQRVECLPCPPVIQLGSPRFGGPR